MSSRGLKVWMAQVRELMMSATPGVFITMDEANVSVIYALLTGPEGTPYEGGFFHFRLEMPGDYPASPPHVKNLTTAGGRVHFNPNLYACGKVCLSILGTWKGPGWTPALSLRTVLLSIQSLLGETPLTNEPGYEDEAGSKRSSNYEAYVRHEVMRAACLDLVTNGPLGGRVLPDEFRRIVQRRFLDKASWCLRQCTALAALEPDGREFRDPLGRTAGHFHWDQLRSRLEAALPSVRCVFSPSEPHAEPAEAAASAGPPKRQRCVEDSATAAHGAGRPALHRM